MYHFGCQIRPLGEPNLIGIIAKSSNANLSSYTLIKIRGLIQKIHFILNDL